MSRVIHDIQVVHLCFASCGVMSNVSVGAAQALLPEALIPLTLLQYGGTSMLVGDPRYPFPPLIIGAHVPLTVSLLPCSSLRFFV